MKEFLKNNLLFQNIKADDIAPLLQCLQAYTKTYKKDEMILCYGDTTHHIGLLLKGEILITKDDYWGNRTILKEIKPGELFAEVYACIENLELEVAIIANEACEVLFLDITHIIRPCGNTCSFHQQVVQNLLMVMAQKNLLLTQKMEHITKRTMRQKILSYLSTLSQKQDSKKVIIPFNRQQFADYLSVDRSALSLELSKMQKEGLIKYKKNIFHLNK